MSENIISRSPNPLVNLEKLKRPFDAKSISKLPKPTKAQNECDYREKVRCDICGGFHHPKVIHLDYVGHAALTARFLEVDPSWNWEPLSLTEAGLPLFGNDGLWIKLTICGLTRIGYGDAPKKKGGDAIKECIGDALRNAAMRFGCALDLWHKGEESLFDESDDNGNEETEDPMLSEDQCRHLEGLCLETHTNIDEFIKKAGFDDLSRVPASQYQGAMNILNKKKEKLKKSQQEDDDVPQ